MLFVFYFYVFSVCSGDIDEPEALFGDVIQPQLPNIRDMDLPEAAVLNELMANVDAKIDGMPNYFINWILQKIIISLTYVALIFVAEPFSTI